MIDQAKISAARIAIGHLADEYDKNGLPDVGGILRELALLPPVSIVRLGELMRAESMTGITRISIADLAR